MNNLNENLTYLYVPGLFPDPYVMGSGERREVRLQPQMCRLLCGLTDLNLVCSSFDLVPLGSVLPYQCPPEHVANYELQITQIVPTICPQWIHINCLIILSLTVYWTLYFNCSWYYIIQHTSCELVILHFIDQIGK